MALGATPLAPLDTSVPQEHAGTADGLRSRAFSRLRDVLGACSQSTYMYCALTVDLQFARKTGKKACGLPAPLTV